MISKKLQSFDAVVIFCLYFVPIFLWNYFSLSLMSPSVSWISLSTGIIIASLGSIFLYLLFKTPETDTDYKAIPELKSIGNEHPKDFTIELNNLQKENAALQAKVETLENEINQQTSFRSLEKEQKEGDFSRLKTQYDDLQKELGEKDAKIQELETRIQELDYEIRTLIDLSMEERLGDEPQTENEAIELSNLVKEKLENAPSNTSLDRLITTDRHTFIFAFSPSDMRIHAFKGISSIPTHDDLLPLLPTKSLSWHEALTQIGKGKSAPIELKNGAQVILAPILKGPFKDLVIGVGI